MKFSVSKEVIQMFEILDKLPHARKIVYATLGLFYLIAITGLIHAVRWW